jgi:CHAD domain-containing protein
MPAAQREVEDKYDVAEDARPDTLDQLPGVASVAAPAEHLLEATYFDTDDLALAAAGITLRRRTGGEDAGWHLKLPAKGARTEIREPLGRSADTVPASLREMVHVVTRSGPLEPIASIRNRRTVYRLLDATGIVLAELADDRVTAVVPGTPGPAAPKSWREWEIELVHAGPDLLQAAADLLGDAGATPAAAPSKLARALGQRMPRRRADVQHDPGDPAATVVHARLRDQLTALRAQDPLVRAGLPEGVHEMRVAIRRLRDALATYRPLLQRESTEPLREELKWLANELGAARDVEVQRRRLEARVAGLTTGGAAELVRGPLLARVEEDLARQFESARSRSLEALESDRYHALLDSLGGLVDAPPWTERAGEPAGNVLRGRVRHDWKRLKSRVEDAHTAVDAVARATRLHEARKAAKRTRYAGEPLVPLYGKDAKRFVKAVKRVQSALGDHHDAFVAQALLRDLADRAAEAGDNAFTFGVLHAEEAADLTACEQRFEVAWAKASRRKVRRWLA